ncbi:MAG: hypothetical protein QNK33_00860 [Bacteroidales bacterium]|nr:hypothetical protein [Bacteroidales bacterium]
MKRILNPKFSLSLLFIFATLSVFAQIGDEIDKSYKWNFDLAADGVLELDNYDCDIIIHTWDKEKAELQLHLLAEMKTNKDAKILDEHLQNLEFDNSPSRVAFSTRFWKNKKQIVTRKTVTLRKGLTIPYSKLKVKAELWLPESAELRLKSKYSKIDLAEINGQLYLNLYNDDLIGKSVAGNMEVEAKYSKIDLDNCKDIVAELYDCEFTTLETANCNYNSKYSKISSSRALSLTIESYNDKYLIESCGDIDMVSKYTDLTTREAGKVKIDSYEGSYTIAKCQNIEIKAKYTNFLNESAGDLIITNIYEGSFGSLSINSLSIEESKYVKYKLGSLNKSLSLENGYEDDFFIDELGADFSGLDLNGKYINCEAVISDDLKFKVKANIKYPHLDFEKVGLTTKIKIKESSQLEYEAFKGEDSESLPLISLSGYEITFKVK